MLLTSLVQNRVDGTVEEFRHHRHATLEGDDVLRLCCGRHVAIQLPGSEQQQSEPLLRLLPSCLSRWKANADEGNGHGSRTY